MFWTKIPSSSTGGDWISEIVFFRNFVFCLRSMSGFQNIQISENSSEKFHFKLMMSLNKLVLLLICDLAPFNPYGLC